jgi:DNA-binding GntR family transcriptional regulator
VERSPELPFQRIVNDLSAQISQGTLLPGEQLPTVTTLCQTYSVSKVTVLKALRTLADAGQIRIVPRWGTFVADRP